MYFKRKAYDSLLKWKKEYADHYAVLLEGARRVGKSTIAETFAQNEYESYILIDFARAQKKVLACFEDVDDLNLFFLRLQAATETQLIEHKSVIIFDEVQLFPKARQAIKYLVADGRYHYIETGSLISIKKNVEGILIPSEEKRIQIYPMDYEEFMDATGNNTYDVLRQLYQTNKAIGQGLNRKLMRDFRIYMAVGGMPQAIDAYIQGKNFTEIDEVKRDIIRLYESDFKKIDPTGTISRLYHSIPSQLSRDAKRYSVSKATGKRKGEKDDRLLSDLLDSKTVLASYNTNDPRVSLALTKDTESYKLYVADTGLFVTLMFMDRPSTKNEIYLKLLSDHLPANLGYLYENAVAQLICAKDYELYYHTWEKEDSTHYYEVDFLIPQGEKMISLEVKSSGTGKHESILTFNDKFSKHISNSFIVSQKDRRIIDDIENIPLYMLPFVIENDQL